MVLDVSSDVHLFGCPLWNLVDPNGRSVVALCGIRARYIQRIFSVADVCLFDGNSNPQSLLDRASQTGIRGLTVPIIRPRSIIRMDGVRHFSSGIPQGFTPGCEFENQKAASLDVLKC